METSSASVRLKIGRVRARIDKIYKGDANPYFKSHYAGLPTILDAVMPELEAEGLVLTQEPDFAFSSLPTVTTTVTETVSPGIEATEPQVKKTVTQTTSTTLFRFLVTVLYDPESGEWVEGRYLLTATKPQAVGSELSYARRYTLQSLLSLNVADDDGEAAEGRKPMPSTATTTQSMKERMGL